MPVWQSDHMAPSSCARHGRTAAFFRWCQRPTIVLKRRMTAHQYASTWFERLRKETHSIWTCVRALRVDQYMASHGLEKFSEDILTSPEIIRAQTLNFKPNFKFSQSKVFWGTPIPIWVCGIRLGQSVACINI